MWKAAKPGEPSWETPWGRGRPGWHLECSAMAHKYLGSAFDLHGGGVDLVFPHHENEIAQSKAYGDEFARYWAHNAWVTLSGEKMSKSLGNSVLIEEMVKHWRPIVLRYYLGSPHYRSTIEYSEESLREAEAAFGRIEGFLQRAGETVGEVSPAAEVPADFAEAMDDDFAVPQALAVVHTTVRQGNAALSEDDKDTVAKTLADVRAMLGVLGLDPLDARWQSTGADAGRGGELRGAVDALVRLVLDQRQAARARKDYVTADAIRDELKQAGLVVEDTPSGPRWELDSGSGPH
jgi:cysteinyl-tRNA synthetase